MFSVNRDDPSREASLPFLHMKKDVQQMYKITYDALKELVEVTQAQLIQTWPNFHWLTAFFPCNACGSRMLSDAA